MTKFKITNPDEIEGAALVEGKYISLSTYNSDDFHGAEFVVTSDEFGKDCHAQTIEKFQLIKEALDNDLVSPEQASSLARNSTVCGYCIEYGDECFSCPVKGRCRRMVEIDEIQEKLAYALQTLEEMGE